MRTRQRNMAMFSFKIDQERNWNKRKLDSMRRQIKFFVEFHHFFYFASHVAHEDHCVECIARILTLQVGFSLDEWKSQKTVDMCACESSLFLLLSCWCLFM
jgi:hypothetical protein